MKKKLEASAAAGDLAKVVQAYCDCCWVSSVKEGGCKLELPEEGSVACFSGSKCQTNHNHRGKLGDHIVFWSEGSLDRTTVVELKGRNPSAGIVQEQLQRAADLAESLVGDWPHEVGFAAAVLHRGVSSTGFKALTARKIRFRNRDYRLMAKRCGVALQQLHGVSGRGR